MSKDILLEIGTEEMPAKFVPAALEQLENLAKAKLDEERIAFQSIRAVGTPRRMALMIQDVAEVQADKQTESKGPSVKIAFDAAGAPTKAAQGFARGQKIDVSQLTIRDGYVYACVHEQGKSVAEILPELLSGWITGLNFPKNMRWGSFDMRFARPIRWLVALFGGDVVPFELAGVKSGNRTRGHRFLSSGEFEVKSANDYFKQLSAHHVMVDQDVRRQVIREQVEKIAAQNGGTARIDEELLEEVIYLVEYPTALAGRFEDHYLALPPEAVITPMREHQRYFPVFNAEGKLLPLFITVRNGGADYIDIVRHGNERVLRARLADAQFFFEEDCKAPLADRVAKLQSVVYQEGLGTLLDKTNRLAALSGAIAKQVGLDSTVLPVIERGAHLAKADLVTGMVCEFTELQGVMGREYARLSGESQAVADTIYEHYLPRFAGDELPRSDAGRAVSIADKLDNIVATFSRGLIPTGSQDPFALRRQAIGIVNTVIDAKWNVSLAALTETAMDLLGVSDAAKRADLTASVQEFFRLRLKNILSDAGIRYDAVEAVLAAGADNPYDAWLRASALASEQGGSALRRSLQALTRTGNLAKNASDAAIQPELLEADAEKALFAAYDTVQAKAVSQRRDQDYIGLLETAASLTSPIDTFFSEVMVMVEDEAVRNNRLALLKAITQILDGVADISKVVE